ncbi:MAG: hypothetical protein K6G11_08950 [Lachnospiraceae bacterium]|nr:hypothetical protein [Lachnospiraceae bacterium]
MPLNSIDILQEVGFDDIEAHEKALNKRLIDGLKKMPRFHRLRISS